MSSDFAEDLPVVPAAVCEWTVECVEWGSQLGRHQSWPSWQGGFPYATSFREGASANGLARFSSGPDGVEGALDGSQGPGQPLEIRYVT